MSERSRRANLRADVQKLHQAEPQGESAQHDEARPDHWGMVNAVSAGKDHVLTRGLEAALLTRRQ